MKNYIIFAFLMSFLTFCFIGDVPISVKGASIYDIPDDADPYRYLARTYPTFGDFLQFACAFGTDNIVYGVYSVGSNPNRSASFRFQLESNGRQYYVSYLVPTGSNNDTSLSLLTLDASASAYSSGITDTTSFTGFFNAYFADYPNLPLYETVKDAADLNADSVRKFRLILFAFSALLFVVLSRRF